MRLFKVDKNGNQILEHRVPAPCRQVNAMDGIGMDQVDYIADFIGARLESDRRGTISVHQTKSKFGQCRVYCRLADEAKVKALWDHPGEVSSEFHRLCYLHDAKRYRTTYMMMIELFPQYYDSMRNGCDYSALLCMTKDELDELLDSKYPAGVNRDEESRKDLYKICGFD